MDTARRACAARPPLAPGHTTSRAGGALQPQPRSLRSLIAAASKKQGGGGGGGGGRQQGGGGGGGGARRGGGGAGGA